MTKTTFRPTLGDVLNAVDLASIADHRKRDEKSAVRQVARVIGLEPGEIEASIPKLRRKLDQQSAQALGLSVGRWANIRSLLGSALSRVQSVQPSRQREPVTPHWAERLNLLTPELQRKLSPLIRHLGAQGVDPKEVTEADVQSYGRRIVEDRLRANPERTWDHLLWAWNRAADASPDWPQFRLEREDRRDRYVVPFSAFPSSLEAEAHAFGMRLMGGDLDDEGPIRPVRAVTRDRRLYQLRVAASALVHRGRDPQSIGSIAELVTIDAVREIARFMLDRQGGQPTNGIAQQIAFLKDVARHWVKVDDAHLGQLKRLVAKLTPRSGGMTPRNRDRLRPFDDPQIVADFLDLPHRLRLEIEAGRCSKAQAPYVAQMAAAIALLQMVPIRRKNLANLDLEQHFVQRGQSLYLVIAEDETKNREPIDFVLPDRVADMLVWYIRNHRLRLVEAPSQALFPGRGGKPKSAHTLGIQIGQTIKRYLGIDFNVHLFRHVAGKIFLDQKPGQYEVVRQVLRHRSIATTTSFYAGAETQSASRHFASVLDELRARQVATQHNRPRAR